MVNVCMEIIVWHILKKGIKSLGSFKPISWLKWNTVVHFNQRNTCGNLYYMVITSGKSMLPVRFDYKPSLRR
jgi:hypothetical protein